MRKIKDWPEDERPREKLLKNGSHTLTEAELPALVLRTGDAASKTSAVDHARLLLTRLNIGALLAASYQTAFDAVRELTGILPASERKIGC